MRPNNPDINDPTLDMRGMAADPFERELREHPIRKDEDTGLWFRYVGGGVVAHRIEWLEPERADGTRYFSWYRCLRSKRSE